MPEECSCEKPDGKCICIEEGGIRYESFIDTVSTLANLTMEGVIAELIDNSLDEDATNVEIEFVGKNRKQFSVIVYDNGNGIENDEALQEAFSLAHLKDALIPKKKDGIHAKTGKFNFGLKISPFSRCNNVTMR